MLLLLLVRTHIAPCRPHTCGHAASGTALVLSLADGGTEEPAVAGLAYRWVGRLAMC